MRGIFLTNGLETVVYVIDGLSTDNTREIAVEKGAYDHTRRAGRKRIGHSNGV